MQHLRKVLLPLHNASDQQDGKAQQRRGNGVHANGAAKHPQAHRHREGEGRDLLVRRQRPCNTQESFSFRLMYAFVVVFGNNRSPSHAQAAAGTMSMASTPGSCPACAAQAL